MPERWGNVPGIDRSSRDPKVQAASSLLPLPSDNTISIVTTNQTANALHGRACGRCSKAGNWDQNLEVIRHENLSLTLDVMTAIEMEDQTVMIRFWSTHRAHHA
jgi:hypothetical protein